MKIGFIGFGEAAFELSSGLKKKGLENIFVYDPLWEHELYGSLIQERVKQASVKLMTSEKDVLKEVDILFIAVPADKTFEVSTTIKPHIQKECMYIDITAANPTVKQKVWENIREKGVKFVDVAMMGPLVVYKHKVPILASGNGTEEFINYMERFGMNISKVSDTPGDASAVKLIRSIYTKGVSALLFEMLEAANKFDVENLVIDSLSETLDTKSFKETMNRLVTGTSVHALRRSNELEGTIAMLDSLNINSEMSKAARDKLKSIADTNIKEKFKGEKPKVWSDVINVL